MIAEKDFSLREAKETIVTSRTEKAKSVWSTGSEKGPVDITTLPFPRTN